MPSGPTETEKDFGKRTSEEGTIQEVRNKFSSYGICGGRCDTDAGVLRELRFPRQIIIPLTAPHSSVVVIIILIIIGSTIM
jgi:hypothetical protein